MLCRCVPCNHTTEHCKLVADFPLQSFLQVIFLSLDDDIRIAAEASGCGNVDLNVCSCSFDGYYPTFYAGVTMIFSGAFGFHMAKGRENRSDSRVLTATVLQPLAITCHSSILEPTALVLSAGCSLCHV